MQVNLRLFMVFNEETSEGVYYTLKFKEFDLC